MMYRRIVPLAWLLGLWAISCGGKGSTGPEEPEVSQASYAVFGMLTSVGEEMAEFGGNYAVMVFARKGASTEDVSSWPSVRPSSAKLVGQEELTLTEMPVPGDIAVYIPEGALSPGESYRLQVEVEGKTFTSRSAATVLPPLKITTPDGQQVEPRGSLTVRWEAVEGAEAYAVTLAFPDGGDTTFVVGKDTEIALSGELFGQEGEYRIDVTAFAGRIVQYIGQWLGQRLVPIFDFDDPKVLGTFFSTTGDDISVQVGEGEVPEQPGEMEVTVSDGLTPTISWTGGNARMLSVMGEESDIMWAIAAMGPSGFAPPVTYGQVPAGAMQVSPPKTLVKGTRYQVIVQGLREALGLGTFTP